MKYSAILLSAAVFAGGVNAADLSEVPSGTYVVDAGHSYIHFQYNHLGLSNPKLAFDEFQISMDLDNAEPTNTKVSLDIKTDSVQTGSESWYDHITGAKWFDAANNPSITFASTAVSANADGTYDLTGDLTIKDQTHPVVLKVTINAAMMHPMAKKPVIGLSAVGGLKRSQWGMGGNVPFISDDVKLFVEAEMLKGE